MTDAETAHSKLLSSLAAAKEDTRQDAAIHALLQQVHVQAALVYVFPEYGSRGFALTLPEQTKVRPWKLSALQLLQTDEATLATQLVAWIQNGTPPRCRSL